ncbi:MFS transporter [Pseudonocardia acaciae]|uniref:MFS transporter n=1 Tax=Pseudonocardia acaciae TaxID=551276 RepID=UPI0004904BAE|nr:MFS transporter [Pseudonocardia acaciae]
MTDRTSTKMGTAKIAAAALAGSSIENYDFFIYGTAAALVFPSLFFPEQSALTSALLAFATFSVGFLARPLGAVLFGHYGDVHGRKKALTIALVSMGFASVLIGLLPPFRTIGVAAPLILVLLRFVQGIAMGGQQGGVVLLAMESAPDHKRGFYSSFAQAGGPAGILIGNLVFLIALRTTSPEAFQSWGWRVPFLCSAVLIALAVYIQYRLEETHAFQRHQQVKEVAPEAVAPVTRSPILDVLRIYPRQIALVAAAYIGINVTYYLYMTFVVSYATNPALLGMSKDVVLGAVLLAAGVQLVTLPIAGAVSDRVGRRRMLLIGSGATVIFSFGFWPMIDTRSPAVVVLALVVALGVLHTIMYGPQSAFFAETFATRMRYSGISLGVQIGAVCGGAFAPLIATALIAGFHSSFPVALYMALVCVITFAAVWMLKETYLTKLDEPDRRTHLADDVA